MELRMHADPPSDAERGQALRDAAVGTAQAYKNAEQARAGLVHMTRLANRQTGSGSEALEQRCVIPGRARGLRVVAIARITIGGTPLWFARKESICA